MVPPLPPPTYTVISNFIAKSDRDESTQWLKGAKFIIRDKITIYFYRFIYVFVTGLGKSTVSSQAPLFRKDLENHVNVHVNVQ